MYFSSINGIGAAQLGAAADANVRALQAAVRALGQRVGDSTLVIVVDGLMGPKTAAAVNKAFSKYLTNAPVPYRTGKLEQSSIKANAATLAKYVQAAPVAAAPVKAAAAKTKTAAVKAVKTAVTSAKSPAIKALQQALHALGIARKDKTLQIVADGLIGPKTIAAVNRAMTTYATNAPASVRRGNFTKDEIVSGAETLAQYIAGISAAAGVPAAAPAVAAAAKPTPKQNGKAVFSGLQEALKNLGDLVGNKTLSAVVVDGIVGPKTAQAVNIALTQYVAAAYAPAALRTGRLTAAQVASAALQLSDVVNRENVRRAGAAAPEAMPAPVVQAAAEAEAAAEAAPDSYVPEAPPAAAMSPQAAANQRMEQQYMQQQQQAAQQVPSSQTTYMPPGAYAPSGDELAPAESLAPAPASESPGAWASLSTGGKIAVGMGVGAAVAGLIYALTRKSGPAPRYAYARR